MPHDWKTVVWGAALGFVLTMVVTNFAPSVLPYVAKVPAPAGK